jgi:hypothetical protein
MSTVKIVRENTNTGGGMVYCLGFIGAIVYYWQLADTFGQFVMGFLKALVWPAMVVYNVLQYFQFHP